MSVKAPVAPSPELEEIDRHLAVLSDMLKKSNPDMKELYVRKANKLLDKRNKLTNA